MDTSQQADCDRELESLFGAWGRLYSPQLQAGYWKGLAKMALGDLARTIQRAIEQFADDPDMKLPTVGVLWQIRRSLRAIQTVPAKPPEPEMDRWTVAANLHLLSEVRRRAKHYAPDSQIKPYGGPETARRTAIAVEWKNAWARDMRDADSEGAVPQDGGKVWWRDCMTKADAQMRAA